MLHFYNILTISELLRRLGNYEIGNVNKEPVPKTVPRCIVNLTIPRFLAQFRNGYIYIYIYIYI